MKRSVAFVVFFLVFGFALAGLYWSQRRAKSIPVSPNAILNMAADAQRDLSRLPMHLTRLTDEQEVAFGRDFAFFSPRWELRGQPTEQTTNAGSLLTLSHWTNALAVRCTLSCVRDS